MTDDERMDFTALDPTRDQIRFERAVRAITAQAAPLLEARRVRQTSLGVISSWRRPLWLFAATIGLVAGAFLLRDQSSEVVTVASASPFADALGVPSAVSSHLSAGTLPSLEELTTSGALP